MSESGQALSGLITTQSKYANSTVTIDSVEATMGGKGIAGIVEGVNLDKPQVKPAVLVQLMPEPWY